MLGPPANGPERPLVVIPGILGSRLVTESGEVLWGDDGVASLWKLARLDLDPARSDAGVEAQGLVKEIHIFGPFWPVHVYDDLLDHLRSLGFRDGSTLFTFAYDWRQSNDETARRFDTWVRETEALGDDEFDIVAHSMGGIVAKIWALKHDGAQRLHKIIYLGTPFWGSMKALATLGDGWGAFQNLLAGGIDAIRSTILSFPALYELFPRYRESCRLGDERQNTPLNIYDAKVWNERDWLPPAYRAGGPRDTLFRANLERADALRDVMDAPLPHGKEIRVAGDHQTTSQYLYLSASDPSWRSSRFSKGRGDGTVSLWSAADAMDGNLAGARPAFAEHATIFRDDYVKAVLRNELIKTAPPPVNAVSAELRGRDGAPLSLELVDVALDPPVAAPNESVRVAVLVRFSPDSPVTCGDLDGVTAQLGETDGRPLDLVEITTEADLADKTLRFAADVRAPAVESVHRVDVAIPPFGERAAYLTVGSER